MPFPPGCRGGQRGSLQATWTRTRPSSRFCRRGRPTSRPSSCGTAAAPAPGHLVAFCSGATRAAWKVPGNGKAKAGVPPSARRPQHPEPGAARALGIPSLCSTRLVPSHQPGRRTDGAERLGVAPRDRRAGAIVNISSLASLAGGFQMAYEMSKAGMNRMTQSVAMSGASRGVRCNAILPGLMDTPMAIRGISKMRGIPEGDLRKERAARVPMGFMGSGWDTAHAALFLASDEARFITGALLPVDGGGSVRIG